MVPDREIGSDEIRPGRRIVMGRRWSDGTTGQVVPIEALARTDARAESNVAPNGQPGHPVDHSPEPVASSRSRDEHAAEPETVAQPADQPACTDNGLHEERAGRPLPSVPFPAALTQAGRQEWCAIVFAGAERQGEFRAVVVDNGGQRRVVARSPSFRASHSGRVSHRGDAKEAHDLLVKRLLALGWHAVPSRGRWHDTAFTRTPPASDGPVERLLITCRSDRLAARFQAARFDDLGNATIASQSATFRALHLRGSMKLTRQAAKAHHELLERLRADGWQTTGSSGVEWYAQVLERPAGLRSVR